MGIGDKDTTVGSGDKDNGHREEESMCPSCGERLDSLAHTEKCG